MARTQKTSGLPSSDEKTSTAEYHSFSDGLAIWTILGWLSPRHLDSAFAGLTLAATGILLRAADVALGDYAPPLFAFPALSSGILFFAGPNPPPPRGFLSCTVLAYATGAATLTLPISDAPTRASLCAGALLILFRSSNNFFVPTLGLAVALLNDPTVFEGALAGTERTLRLLASSLLGQGILYAAAHPFAAARRRVRVYLGRRRFAGTLRRLDDEALRVVFQRYDTSGDGFLQAGELRYAWQAATGDELNGEEDAAALVRSIDLDGNGEIDVHEFMQLVRTVDF